MWVDWPCGSFAVHKAGGGCLIRGSPGVEYSRWLHHIHSASGDSQKAASTRTLVLSQNPLLLHFDQFCRSSGLPQHTQEGSRPSKGLYRLKITVNVTHSVSHEASPCSLQKGTTHKHQYRKQSLDYLLLSVSDLKTNPLPPKKVMTV